MSNLKELGNIAGIIMDEYDEKGEQAFFSNRRMIINLREGGLISDADASILLAFNIKESGTKRAV